VQAGSQHKDNLDEMSRFWPEGSIHVFEPNPALFEELRAHVERWNMKIALYPFDLSDVNGNALFYTDDQGINPRAGSLLQAADPWKWYYKDSCIFSVPCLNLEEWASMQNISAIDLLWLNTGGTELQILKSITHLLPAIQILVLETHDREFRIGTGLYPKVRHFLEEMNFVQIQHWRILHFQGIAVFIKAGFVLP